MKKNRAFAILLFVMLLLVVYGLCVLIAGVDLYRNRPLAQEAPFQNHIVSYAAYESRGLA